MSCDPTQNGFQFTENYVLGLGGEELTMLDGNNNWQRTNVFVGGKLIGNYDLVSNPANSSQQIPWLHFHLEDPLGTRRMQVSGMLANLGQPETDFQSLPYGDQLDSFPDAYADQIAPQSDSTPLHYTGKERDSESGNDYFSARYFASSMGRFLSPDIVGGDLSNPQSLNRYAYALSNPLFWTDPSGFQVATGTSCGNVGTQDNPVIQCSNNSPPPSSGGGDLLGQIDSEVAAALPVGSDGGLTSTSISDAVGSASGQSGASQAAQAGLDMAGMIPGPVGMAANIASAGMSAYNGHYGAAALSLAFALPVVGQLGAEAHGLFEAGEIGYRSFDAFKAAHAAEEGMQWHHIVEQTPGNLARFGPGAIHNVENLVQVPRDLHIGRGSISAYYSSIQDFTGGPTVRGWLAPQSFESQRDFGLQVLRSYGIIP